MDCHRLKRNGILILALFFSLLWTARAHTPLLPKPWTKTSANGRFVLALEKGVVVDQKAIRSLQKEMKEELSQLEERGARKKAIEYRRRYMETRIAGLRKGTKTWYLVLYRKKGEKLKRIWRTVFDGHANADRFLIEPNGRKVALLGGTQVDDSECGMVEVFEANGKTVHEWCVLEKLTEEEKQFLPSSPEGRIWRGEASFDSKARYFRIKILQDSPPRTDGRFETISLRLDTLTGDISRR